MKKIVPHLILFLTTSFLFGQETQAITPQTEAPENEMTAAIDVVYT